MNIKKHQHYYLFIDKIIPGSLLSYSVRQFFPFELANFSSPVVLDESGFSKGFGFIRFNNEVEQQTAMTSMNGMSGLGGKPIKVSVAVNKIKDGMNGGGGHGNVPDHIYKQVTNNVVGKLWTSFVAW